MTKKKLNSGKHKGTVGIAISGGWGKAIAHVGVFKALLESDIRIDEIVSTSAGSAVSAAIALGIPFDEIIDWVQKANNIKVFSYKNFRLCKDHLFETKEVDKALEELFGNKTFKDTLIKLKISCLDLKSGKEYIIEKGKIKDAVRAAISVPILFKPTRYRKAILIDAATFHNVPTYELGDDIDVKIGVALYLQDDEAAFKKVIRKYERACKLAEEDKFSIKKRWDKYKLGLIMMPLIFERTVDVLRTRIKDEFKETYSCDIDLVVPTQKVPYFTFENSVSVNRIIELGEQTVKKHIPEIKKKLNEIENGTYVQTCDIHE